LVESQNGAVTIKLTLAHRHAGAHEYRGLAGLLKRLGRQWGWRAIRIERCSETAPEPAEGEDAAEATPGPLRGK
jgi:hypothetical protein